MIDVSKAPWPWFGGKRHAAPLIWERLGDVGHYVEPFAGSLATLLLRPHVCNRTYHSETVNDLDGYIVNAWRSIQQHPQETAEWASWPVSEADLHARHLWLLAWARDGAVDRLCGTPDWCDPKAAGWWMWGQSSWIGSGWCSGRGRWVVGADGHIVRRDGDGIGAHRKRPHIGDNGMGVNHAGLREEGVGDPEFHPMTMPELRRWFDFLSARLRHVRILNGDWHRAVTNGATISLSVDLKSPCGVMLDPPYSTKERTDDLYAVDSGTVAAEVREWCAENGANPLYRIALCGFEGEGHESLVDLGWTEEEWFSKGFLTGGMGNIGGKTQAARDRIWFSPHCLRPSATQQGDLFAGVSP